MVHTFHRSNQGSFLYDSYILYTYNANGEKLKTAYFINQMTPAVPQVGGGTGGGQPQMTVTTLKYCNGLIFENNTLKQIPIEGGYVTFNGTTPQYHFYIQDHQGNNRVVCDESGTIEQVNHYYPYGGLFGESTNDEVQRYKYNGKELDRMHGLNLYDYGARQYDAALGQFTTMDPLCEKYYHISPYAYCHDNPMNRIDPDGRDDLFNDVGQFVERTTNGSAVMIMCGNQYKNIAEVNFLSNRGAIENIARHYMAKADKAEFNLSVTSTDGKVPPGAAFSNHAGTQNYDIYLTDGYVNKALGNCYDFECITYHESTHRYDSSTHGGTIGEVNAIIRTANECPAWTKASDSYIQSQASYAASSLNGNRSGIAIPNSIIKKLNDAFLGCAKFELNNNKVTVSNILKECVIELKKDQE